MPHDWYDEFFTRHMARYPRDDWPVDDDERFDEFWKNWRVALKLKGATKDEADRASQMVAFEHPKYLDAHLSALIALIVLNRNEGKPGSASPLDQAKADSRHCIDCRGEVPAAAVRWPHDPNHARYGYSMAFRCACPLGRYLHEQDRFQPSDKRLNMAFLGDYPTLQLGPCPWGEAYEHPGGEWGSLDNRFRYSPDQWDVEVDCPKAFSTPEQFDLSNAKARLAAMRARQEEASPLAVTPQHIEAMAAVKAGPFPKPESAKLRATTAPQSVAPMAYADVADAINADDFDF